MALNSFPLMISCSNFLKHLNVQSTSPFKTVGIEWLHLDLFLNLLAFPPTVASLWCSVGPKHTVPGRLLRVARRDMLGPCNQNLNLWIFMGPCLQSWGLRVEMAFFSIASSTALNVRATSSSDIPSICCIISTLFSECATRQNCKPGATFDDSSSSPLHPWWMRFLLQLPISSLHFLQTTVQVP